MKITVHPLLFGETISAMTITTKTSLSILVQVKLSRTGIYNSDNANSSQTTRFHFYAAQPAGPLLQNGSIALPTAQVDLEWTVPTPGDGGPNAPTGWGAEAGTWTEDPAGTFNLLPNGDSYGRMYREALYPFTSGTFTASVDAFGPVLPGLAGLTVEFLSADGLVFITENGSDVPLVVTAASLAPFGTVANARVYLRALSSTPFPSAVTFNNLSVVVTP